VPVVVLRRNESLCPLRLIGTPAAPAPEARSTLPLTLNVCGSGRFSTVVPPATAVAVPVTVSPVPPPATGTAPLNV
jgi:hypothetical protein